MIKFNKLKQDDIDVILNLITTPCSHTEEVAEYIIDFDKIIPEPKTKEECPDKYRMSEDSYVSAREDKPWFNWYSWHIDYWGTKWGAYDGYTLIGKSWIKFVFSTAWSLAYPIISKLALMGYNFEVKYADEDLGSNCGIITYSNEQGFDTYPETELNNPYKFARNLWHTY